MSLIEAAKSNKFHYSWLLVLLNRAFFHESKVIVKWAVAAFLQSNMHTLIKRIPSEQAKNFKNTLDKFNSFIMGPLMLILQKFYLYNR